MHDKYASAWSRIILLVMGNFFLVLYFFFVTFSSKFLYHAMRMFEFTLYFYFFFYLAATLALLILIIYIKLLFKCVYSACIKRQRDKANKQKSCKHFSSSFSCGDSKSYFFFIQNLVFLAVFFSISLFFCSLFFPYIHTRIRTTEKIRIRYCLMLIMSVYLCVP